MSQHENLEFHAVQSFIEQYNVAHKPTLEFIKHCKPPMPDTLCCLDRKEIGVEVVHAYGSKEEAAMRLGNRSSGDFSDKVHRARRIIPLNVRALNSLNQVLHNKATKQYAISPTWLVIRNAFYWSKAEYEKHRNEIIVPHVHPFEQIWFLFDRNSIGKQGIMRLA